MDFKALECRVKPVKLTQYKIEQEGSNVVKSKKTKEYDYYLCDKCKEKIIMTIKFEDRTGGLLSVPISSSKSLELALCNKCLKKTLKEINKFYKINL